MISARLARARRGRTTNLQGLSQPGRSQGVAGTDRREEAAGRETEGVEKKEPEKPRAVIDVFRGDKHVQEMFK